VFAFVVRGTAADSKSKTQEPSSLRKENTQYASSEIYFCKHLEVLERYTHCCDRHLGSTFLRLEGRLRKKIPAAEKDTTCFSYNAN